MAQKNIWKFKNDDQAIDLINDCICKVLVLNNSNDKLERRYYVETVDQGLQSKVHEWRKENELRSYSFGEANGIA